MGSDNSDKEAWIGALGKAMIKTSVMIEDNMEGVYMWLKKLKTQILNFSWLFLIAWKMKNISKNE